MSFPSIVVSQTRVFQTTCNAATATPTCIRATLEFAFLASVLKTVLNNISNYPCEQLDNNRMPIPRIFVSPTRIFKASCNTATGTPTSIRANARSRVPRIRLKSELHSISDYTFEQLVNNYRMSFPIIFLSHRRAFSKPRPMPPQRHQRAFLRRQKSRS